MRVEESGDDPVGAGGAKHRRAGPDRVRRVAAAGVELAVAEWGDAGRPTVLLLHGYPDTKEVWAGVAERLRDRFHVVAYDVRGHGQSTAPRPARGGYRLRRLADDFAAVLEAVSPGRPVHLVGHDWGSVQGWEFVSLERFDGRLASFTSISGPGLDHLGLWFRERGRRPSPPRLARLAEQSLRSWYVYALHAPVVPELAWRGPLGAAWPRLLARREKLPAGDYPTATLPRDAAHGARLYRDNVRERMLRPRTDARARVPVQLVTPTRDPFLSPHVYDDLDRWAPRLLRRTLAAGHWLPRARPELLARWIDGFVRDVERGAVPTGTVGAFDGRLVLVTGAASGIGRATALAFAAAGARVVAVDRDGEGAARTADEAERAGAEAAWAEVVDVGDAEAMTALADRVHGTYGVLDVLVNNAGVGISGPFLATSPEDWRRTLDVNLWGVIHGCRLFGARMAERGQGGHIVNIASAAAYQPSRLLPAYGTTKAAVLMLTECLRLELAGRGIGVSAVCPGFVNTSITTGTRFVGVSDAEQERLRDASARWYGRRDYPPEKVAAAVLRAVEKDAAVVPVTPEARALLLLSRLSPTGRRAIGRVSPSL